MSVQTQSAGPETEIRQADGDSQEYQVDEDLPTDQVFHLLQNERRRAILRYLQGTEGVVDMREIVENVAAEEYDTDPRSLSSTQRQRVYIALYQSHLPKLADYGVIEYDQSRGRVERTEVADELDGYLDDRQQASTAVAEPETIEPWDRYYRGAAVVSPGLVIAGYLALGGTSGFVVAGAIVAVFVSLAAAQWLLGR